MMLNTTMWLFGRTLDVVVIKPGSLQQNAETKGVQIINSFKVKSYFALSFEVAKLRETLCSYYNFQDL